MATDITNEVWQWWRGLYPRGKHDPNRADRARLRRCETPLETLEIQQLHALLRAARGKKYSNHNRLLVIAAVFASIKPPEKPTHTTFAEVLGRSRSGPGPAREGSDKLCSPTRFNNVLRALDSGSDIDRIRVLRRACKLVAGQGFDRSRLIADLLYFNDRTTRRDWLYQYWGTWRDGVADAEDAPVTEDSNAAEEALS